MEAIKQFARKLSGEGSTRSRQSSRSRSRQGSSHEDIDENEKPMSVLKNDQVVELMMEAFCTLDTMKDGYVRKDVALRIYEDMALSCKASVDDMKKARKECEKYSEKAHKLDVREWTRLIGGLEASDATICELLQKIINGDSFRDNETTGFFPPLMSAFRQLEEPSKKGWIRRDKAQDRFAATMKCMGLSQTEIDDRTKELTKAAIKAHFINELEWLSLFKGTCESTGGSVSDRVLEVSLETAMTANISVVPSGAI